VGCALSSVYPVGCDINLGQPVGAEARPLCAVLCVQWTGWCLLVVLALYDLCAVLTPCGPLRWLVSPLTRLPRPAMPLAHPTCLIIGTHASLSLRQVGLMQEYNEPMPGLLYEASLPQPGAAPPSVSLPCPALPCPCQRHHAMPPLRSPHRPVLIMTRSLLLRVGCVAGPLVDVGHSLSPAALRLRPPCRSMRPYR
jgi:hypothetical protein